jgi:hypothetical protein
MATLMTRKTGEFGSKLAPRMPWIAKEFLTSRKKKPLLKSANHRNMTCVVNQPKGGDPVSHCLPPRVIDEAWVIVRAKEFRA